MSKFTRGPWHIVRLKSPYEGIEIQTDDDVTLVASLPGKRDNPRGAKAARANARLIAAAPALYAALAKVVAIADRQTTEFDEARAALALVEDVS